MHPDKPTEKRRFRVIVGISVASIEEELNRVDAELDLRQLVYAPGTGFVAVLERSDVKQEDVGRKSPRGKTS